MLWIILLAVFAQTIEAVYRGPGIRCECSTSQCGQHGLRECVSAGGVCFSQALGSQVVRGCIATRTPLLCENRRPAASRATWPLLLCCHTELCNAGAVPSPPPWFGEGAPHLELQSTPPPPTTEALNATSTPEALQNATSSTSLETLGQPKSYIPHIVSPVYIAVLVLGVVSLAIIGIVAAVVLRKSNQYYLDQYGALEHQYEQAIACSKHDAPNETCDCDDESASQSSVPQHPSYQELERSGT